VPPGDVDALAKAMAWMSEHPEKAREMGQQAGEYAIREHSAKIHYKRIISIYQNLTR